MSINYQFFPKNQKITEALTSVVDVFSNQGGEFNSEEFSLESNQVLKFVEHDLESLGYEVEKGKKSEDKIMVPVLYGLNGQPIQRFDADAYNELEKIVIEVEAGRAVANYQFLKDLFEACMMSQVDFLVIAVRNIYKGQRDFEKVITFFETLYVSNKLSIPLKGVLIIGY
jgi:hypothetical protein